MMRRFLINKQLEQEIAWNTFIKVIFPVEMTTKHCTYRMPKLFFVTIETWSLLKKTLRWKIKRIAKKPAPPSCQYFTAKRVFLVLKVYITRNVLLAYSKKLSKWWRLAFILIYCDSTLGCRVMQDFVLCKSDVLWSHIVDIKRFKVEKNGIFLKTVSAWNWNFVQLLQLQKFHNMSIVTFPWQHNGFQAVFIEKVNSEFSSFKKCYLFVFFIQWVWANMDITQHRQR